MCFSDVAKDLVSSLVDKVEMSGSEEEQDSPGLEEEWDSPDLEEIRCDLVVERELSDLKEWDLSGLGEGRFDLVVEQDLSDLEEEEWDSSGLEENSFGLGEEDLDSSSFGGLIRLILIKQIFNMFYKGLSTIFDTRKERLSKRLSKHQIVWGCFHCPMNCCIQLLY